MPYPSPGYTPPPPFLYPPTIRSEYVALQPLAPTIRSEYVALQPLAPPPHPIVCTSVARTVRPSPRQPVVRPVRLSSRQPPQSVYHPARQSHCLSIPPTVRLSSPPVRHTNRPSTLPSLHP